MLAITAGLLATFIGITPAKAYNPPPYSHSWYINKDDSSGTFAWLYTLGKNDGVRDSNSCTNGITVLNFGQPDYAVATYGGGSASYGMRNWNGTMLSASQVIKAAEQYALGWYQYSNNCPKLTLAIGVNNSHECPSLGSSSSCIYNAGVALANDVGQLHSYLVAQGADWQISAAAGDDIETDNVSYDYWDSYNTTVNFLNGYNNTALTPFYDFGDAIPNGSWWTTSNLYYATWGAPASQPLPEAYNDSQINWWKSLYTSYTVMRFPGVMTNCTTYSISCFDPNTGWSHFTSALDGAGYSSTPQWSTNIQWQNN